MIREITKKNQFLDEKFLNFSKMIKEMIKENDDTITETQNYIKNIETEVLHLKEKKLFIKLSLKNYQ